MFWLGTVYKVLFSDVLLKKKTTKQPWSCVSFNGWMPKRMEGSFEVQPSWFL